MNVLIAASYQAPNSGNFIASMLDLANAIRQNGGKVVFLFPKSETGVFWKNWIKNSGFLVYFLEPESSIEEKRIFLQGIVTQNQINLIHTHFGFEELLLLDIHKALGSALLIHDHFDFITNRSQLRQRLSIVKKAIQYRRKDAYCISVLQKKDWWYWPAGKKRHSFIINGLSAHRAEKDPLSPEERRKEIGLKDGEKIALFLGWDLYRKGFDIAAKAAEIYRKTDPTFKLGIIGAGINGKPTKETEIFLRSVGLNPFSEAFLYLHSYEDIFALNRAVDCYISSSRAEAFSYGILESISQNTPLVVSDIVGTRWCWDYTNCYRYPVEDPEAGARALQKALVNGRAPSNYLDYVSKYGNEIWVKRILAYYHQVLENK